MPLLPGAHYSGLSWTIPPATYPQYHGIRQLRDRLPPPSPLLPEYSTIRATHGAFVGSIILDPKNGFASGFERGF